MGDHIDVMQGSLDLLILKAVALEAMHGWGISQRLEQLSSGVLRVQQGSLYPALQRLELQGWIRSEWGVTPDNRRAKSYELTRSGRRQLSREAAEWRRYAVAVQQVLESV